MSLPITDSFGRADTTIGIGDADTGQTWLRQDWTALGFTPGDMHISSGRAVRVNTGTTAAVYIIDAGTGNVDCTLLFDRTTTAGQAGILARYLDASSFIELVNTGVGTLLRRRSGGSYTTLYTDSQPWIDSDTVELICKGNQYVYKRNGVTVTTVTDSTVMAGTNVGLLNFMDTTGQWFFENFSAVAAVLSATATDTASAVDSGSTSVTHLASRSASDAAAPSATSTRSVALARHPADSAAASEAVSVVPPTHGNGHLCRGIAWNGEMFIAVGENDDYTFPLAARSTDGVTWTTTPVDFGVLGVCFCVAYGAGLWVIGGQCNEIGENRTLNTSPDGLTWTIRPNPFDGGLPRGIAWNGSMFVAVGQSAATDGPTIMTSPDGINWTARTSPLQGPNGGIGYGVVWNGSLWVVVGYSYRVNTPVTIVTSPDGINWTERPNPFPSLPAAIAWNGNQFIVVGNGGTLMTSLDGITWTVRSTSTATEHFGVASQKVLT